MIKRLQIIGLFVLMLVSISGCKKKNENAEPQVNYELEAAKEQINSLKEALSLYDSKYNSTDLFKTEDPMQAGQIIFNKVADKIVTHSKVTDVLEEFLYSNNMKSEIVFDDGRITVNPVGWTTNLSSNKIEFNTQNAFGDIGFYLYGDDFDASYVIPNVVEPFFSENEMTLKESKEIYLNTVRVGTQGSARLKILDTTEQGAKKQVEASSVLDEFEIQEYGLSNDSNITITLNVDTDKRIDGTMRIGILNIENLGMVIYRFISENPTADILIDNLLSNGITINGNHLSIQ